MSEGVTVAISENVTSVSPTVSTTTVTATENITEVTVVDNVTIVEIGATQDTTLITEQVTSVDVSPVVTTVEVRGISLATSSATAMSTPHAADSWLTGSTVQNSFDQIGTSVLTFSADQGNSDFFIPHSETFQLQGGTGITTEIKAQNDPAVYFNITNTLTESVSALGAASSVPVLNINQQGQITATSTVDIAIPQSAVTGLTDALYTDTKVQTVLAAGTASAKLTALRMQTGTSEADIITSSGNGIIFGEKSSDLGDIDVHPGITGQTRLHYGNATAGNTDQTLRLHTTAEGVHVGDDITGTYTAGDLMVNQDLKHGMCIGTNITNLGETNVMVGTGHLAYVGSKFSLALGNSIKLQGIRMYALGEDVSVGLGSTSKNIFAGGNFVAATRDFSFTWSRGIYDSSNDSIYRALNHGEGAVMFGDQSAVSAEGAWSLTGGSVQFESNVYHTPRNHGRASIVWGCSYGQNGSDGSITVGSQNSTSATHSVNLGLKNTIGTGGGYGVLIGASHEMQPSCTNSGAFGRNNVVEVGAQSSFAIGQGNTVFGSGNTAIGRNLKTPLQLVNSAYVLSEDCVVVGSRNDETRSYVTNAGNNIGHHHFVVGTGTLNNDFNSLVVARRTSGFSGIIMEALSASPSYSTDTAAAVGGVPRHGLYRDGNNVKIRTY